MRREKSQAPTPAIDGASILPLKQRCAGRSFAGLHFLEGPDDRDAGQA